jgi:DNA-binding NtrC family response regulator
MVRDDPEKWDLVMTDWSMPQMAGDKLALEIHKIRPDMPMVLCTGRGDQISQFAKLPLAAILAKPIFGRRLIEAIGRALDQPEAV